MNHKVPGKTRRQKPLSIAAFPELRGLCVPLDALRPIEENIAEATSADDHPDRQGMLIASDDPICR
jgi:hypothetical protein